MHKVRRIHTVTLHPLMEDYLAFLELRDKALTAVNRQSALRDLAPWMTKHGIDPLRATTQQLQAYQQHLATDYRSAAGQPLSRRSQQNRIGAVKAWYHWLEQRGHIVVDPSRSLRLRVTRSTHCGQAAFAGQLRCAILPWCVWH
jgi:site-specific recombinase XerD